jgi:hypothetical protein
VGRERAKLGQKRRWPGSVGQCGKRPERILLANGQPGTNRVWIDTDALELVEQIREPFSL